MKTVEFLNGWKKNFYTIFLESSIFKNKKEEIDKVSKILTLFSPFEAILRFTIHEDDKIFEEINNDCEVKIIKNGKKLLSQKQYKTIEINTNDKSIDSLIDLLINHNLTCDFELKNNDTIVVSGVLYGDEGESHSIHFDSIHYNKSEIKNKVCLIFN